MEFVTKRLGSRLLVKQKARGRASGKTYSSGLRVVFSPAVCKVIQNA